MSTGRTPRPGLRYGPTNEFAVMFHVTSGHGPKIREILKDQNEEQRQAVAGKIGSLHDARFTLFDDDTRLMFASEFDGDWDQYIDDFASMVAPFFDRVLEHTVDYPGLSDPNAKEFLAARSHTASSYFRTYTGTAKDIQKALRVNRAFQALLDEAAG